MISYNKLPLPADWERKYDFSTKRHFFVNHKLKITTWEDPRKKPGDKSVEIETIGPNDFIEDDADMDKIIKQTEKEDVIQKDLRDLSEAYPEVDNNYIKELLLKSKGNASTVEIILRQQRRKETSSIISYSTIDSGTSGSKNKLGDGEKTRFSLSERYRYDAPETSRDRIKSRLRSEFAYVDNRIVDRVLEVTDYSLEDSRNILLSKNKSIDETIREKEMDKKEKGKDFLPSFKNFVSRRQNSSSSDKTSDNKSTNNKRSIAAGPDPRNYSGSQINKNKFK